MATAGRGEGPGIERHLGKCHRSGGWGPGDTKARDKDLSLQSIPSLVEVGWAAIQGQRGGYITWGMPGKKEGREGSG